MLFQYFPLNGVSVAYFNMPPFIVTLVSMMFFSGTAIFLTASENITHLPSQFIALGKGGISVISTSFLIVLLLSLLAHVLLTRTVLGRQMVAVGLNRQAAVISGIAAKRLIVTAYIFSGLCAAIGSILYSARLEGGRPTLGQDLLLDVIGAAVIGGQRHRGQHAARRRRIARQAACGLFNRHDVHHGTFGKPGVGLEDDLSV
mgnify:CR=1 FL=1